MIGKLTYLQRTHTHTDTRAWQTGFGHKLRQVGDHPVATCGARDSNSTRGGVDSSPE